METVLKIFKRKDFITLLLIVSVCAVVYFPALSHTVRSDQDNYFMETVEIDGLWGLIRETYSYNRWRVFAPGDNYSFKPLYFAFLALGKWLFGFNSFYWQLTSLVLHIILVWQLFRLLDLIFPHILAVFISLHFSVLLITVDMVTFQHMFPCMIQYILLLKSLQHCLLFMKSRQRENRYFWKIFIYLFPVCFIRETAYPYTFIVMIALFAHRKFFLERIFPVEKTSRTIPKWMNPWILSVPLFLFTAWNIYDYFLKGQAARILFKVPGSPALLRFISSSILYPFIPSLFKFNLPQYPHQRVVAETFQLRELMHNYIPGHFFSVLNLILIVLLCAALMLFCIIIFHVKKRCGRGSAIILEKENKIKYVGNGFMAGICFLSAASYCFILFIARFNTYGISALKLNTYYFYPLVMFNSIIIYALFSIIAFYMTKNESRYLTYLSLAVLGLSILLNGYYTRLFNVALKKHGVPIIAERKAAGFKNFYLGTRYNELGFLNAGDGLKKEALENFKKAKEFNPNDKNVDYNLGMAYFERRDYKEAAAFFADALKLNPDDANIVHYLDLANQRIESVNR